MPRSKKDGSLAEPKKRSRTGCWPCKARKVKCGEEKPACANCLKTGERCDYSIRLNWGGRSRKDSEGGLAGAGAFTFVAAPPSTTAHGRHGSGGSGGSGSSSSGGGGGGGHEHVFSAQHIATAPAPRPDSRRRSKPNLPTPEPTPGGDGAAALDPRLRRAVPQPHHHPTPDRPPTAAPPVGGLPSLPPLDNVFRPSSASAAPPPDAADPASDEFRWSPQHGAKRVKLSPTPTAPPVQPSAAYVIPHYPGPPYQSPASTFSSHSIGSVVHTPVTPSSSTHSGSPSQGQPASLHGPDAPDLRRLSVKSLLSEPSDEIDRSHGGRPGAGARMYGYDHGWRDLDIPRNDDNHVILPRHPDRRRSSAGSSDISSLSGEGDARRAAFEPGGYYAQPVAIRIPKVLEPLPDELLRSQMNLLYFHHFINHTSRIMVPHDCPENPFRGVLPQMAVRNKHLLHLLLTFSASHRARLLGHAEPANRIADWMSDVLPALRRALSEPQSPGAADPEDPSSLAPLATAIMFTALAIISPGTFAVAIPWQHHLQVARRLIVAKGGLHDLAHQADGARDKAIFFLSRWFAYQDVLGSLSGSMKDQPLNGAYLEDGGGKWLVNRSDDEIYQIDCFFGFSGRCIALLAQVAELAAQCDKQRIHHHTNRVNTAWKPPDDVRVKALELRKRLHVSATMVYKGCTHTGPHGPHMIGIHTDHDADEVYATNEAYHWAGLIHLARRVLGLPSSSHEVQENVQKVLASLERVPRASSAESCVIFPMVTAACEAQTEWQRRQFMDRLKRAEGWRLQHVSQVRALIGRVWETGIPWETFVSGEFFG